MSRTAARRGARTDLPTGTVTFLFTDIEDSSGLLQRLGDGFRAVLARHDEILRRAIGEHGGVEVNTEGDAFFAVFASATAAVGAAIGAQVGLAQVDWPADGEVRVRMGLHTGAGQLGGDNYLGLDVHRAARVSSAAHGGQILVSSETADQFDHTAMAGVEFRDLGAFTLKGIDGQARLQQVLARGLETDFPPPRAGRRGALPEPRTSFIGRQAALAATSDLLHTTRLLVLTGPGGSGKTRLALELARTAVAHFPDGAFFVPLDAVTDVRLVPPTVLDVVGVPLGNRPADDVLRDTLEPLELLLVLDNLEQIDGIGQFIDELLQAAPQLKVVATSRAALRLYGEQEYPVPSLGLPDAVDAIGPQAAAEHEAVMLFVERARASRPDFRLDAATAQPVVEICRRVDGLPLAIELAAARIRLLSAEQILARLDQRLKLLEGAAPNLPPRQRSIRGAIEWSYALLTADEQQLLNRLSIFVGGWSLPAAESVCATDDAGLDILDGLGSLLDKSLITRRDDADLAEPRFAMLQTIHEFAREQLAQSGELNHVAQRHAQHFRSILEAAEAEFVGADPAACLARLAPDQDNIRAALDWSLATDTAEPGLAIAAAGWRAWQLRGQLGEGRRYLQALLALPSAQRRDELRARALTAAGGIRYWQGDAGAREPYEEARAIYEALGDEAGIAESYSNLGFVFLTARPNDPVEAERQFSEALRRYELLGDQRMVASLTGSLGYSRVAQGRLDEGRTALQRALELNLAGGFRGRAADNRFALGNVLRRLAKFADAAQMYRAALAEAIDMNDTARKVTYLAAIASWAVDVGHFAAAVRLGGAVRRASREQGGLLAGAAGIVDPVDAARSAGIAEDVIAAELETGEQYDSAAAVELARAILDEPLSGVV